MRKLGLILLACVPATAFSQDAKLPSNSEGSKTPSAYSVDYDKCMDKSGGVTADMLECIGPEFRRLDIKLNDAYRRTMTKLTLENKLALRDTQRKWIDFRDTTCSMFGKVSGGTLSLIMDADCRLKTTVERTQWLEDIGRL